MFFGTIHDDVRRYVAGCASAFEGRSVVVGCSGNFTSEKVLAEACKPAAIHSNDVSLYSRLLADAMTDTVTPLTLIDNTYDWIEPYLKSDDLWQRPALVMILLRMLKYEKQKSTHARRMWRNYFAAKSELIKITADRLRLRPVDIASFSSCDVFEHFKNFAENGGDHIYTAYLPFFKGDYEAQYKRLTSIIGWNAPSYPLLDDTRKAEIIRWLLRSNYLFILDHPLENVEPQMVSHKGRNTWVYLYSNLTRKTAIFNRHYNDPGVRYELLSEQIQFDAKTKVGICRISTSHILHYKGLFLARNIDYTGGEVGFAVLVNGKVAGFIEMSKGKYPTKDDAQNWYMLSDFPVEPKPHPRFSKLIVMIALSNEVRKILEHNLMMRSEGVLTTARTERAVSMKYRGPMKLIKRGRDEQGGQFLNYYAKWPNRSIEQQYKLWLQQNKQTQLLKLESD